jgi:BirA family transcriptional regulator, biotin operon repressor / biotin---[acetyl-CoA-carboxylase] ligase
MSLTLAYQVQHLKTTASTMDDVRAAAMAGAAEGLVIRADQQTGGRGRRGRPWFSPAGNLYVSMLLRPAMDQAALGRFSFVASLALAAALPDDIDRDRTRLKWPNDVLVDNAKIAGILLESCNTPQGMALIIGMGVNIAQHPTDAPYPTTSFAALGLGASHTPEKLLPRFLSAFEGYRQDLIAGNFLPIRSAWLAQASGLGEAIVVRLPNQALDGRFMGIDESGCLLLQRPTGNLQRIASGEVFAPTAKVS